jgi:hypothetical protein
LQHTVFGTLCRTSVPSFWKTTNVEPEGLRGPVVFPIHQERTMCPIEAAVFIKLNNSYYIAPVGDPLTLLDDAAMLLEGARGITRLLCELIPQAEGVDLDHLSSALWSVSTLMDMGRNNAGEAYRRLASVRDGVWENRLCAGGE